ncbi:DUF3180 domain-containing protein [Propionibacterium sp.]|uniref:DUF3180 domain-containing protein n=1 Tax=Propionibacterium sp. TaxID=1977903 RepID=UPI0039EB1869
MPERPGTLRPTTAVSVAVAAAVGALLGGALLIAVDRAGSVAPLTPWLLVVLLALGAVLTWWWARAMARTVAQRPEDIDPQRAVAALACAKVAILAGAVLVGFHIVYVLTFIGHLNFPLPRARVIWGSATIVVAVLLACAGRALEKACISPGAGSDDGDAEQNGELTSL